jgi:hypothetical protein
MFGKSTNTGPSIGSSAIGEPGDITFLSGEYNLIGNSSAAIIGGGHGTSEGDKGGIHEEGVCAEAITADIAAVPGGGKLRLVKFDTRQVSHPPDGIYTVTVDGQPFYNGGLHKWHFINESRQKGDQLSIISTPDNWATLGDETNLYF